MAAASRTLPSGAPSEAVAIRPSNPALPLTLVNSATNASVAFFFARALMRWTVEFSSSTSVSVISRCRWNSRAASRTCRTSGAKRRKWPGEDADARARPASMTCTPIPVNTFCGMPTARTCLSLDISSSSELRLTLPGWASMSESTDLTSSSSSLSVVASPGARLSPASSPDRVKWSTAPSSPRSRPTAQPRPHAPVISLPAGR